MKFLIGIALLIVCVLGNANSAELDVRQIDGCVNAALAQWRVPGAVVAVVHGSHEHVAGYGVQKLGASERPSPDTHVPLASCTKALTTTLLAMLADEGKLAWDDPVRKHVPTFHVADPKVDALITLRDLVSHRSGMKGHDFVWYHAPWDRAEIFRRIEQLPVDRPFRSSYEYSTLLFMVAGQAAENSAGKPWETLVHERITEPLGMKSVLFSTQDKRFATAEKMVGHRREKSGRIVPVPVYESREPNSAGSVHLTARDLVPWLRFQLANGLHGTKRLVSVEALQETKQPLNPIPVDAKLRRLNPDTVQMTYAMGWLVYDYRGHPVVAHGGMIDGFRIQVTLFPKDNLGIALVNNLHDTKMNQALTNSLADSILGLPAKDWNAILLEAVAKNDGERAAEDTAFRKARRADVPPSVPLADFVGKYRDAAYGDAEIAFEKGKLVWRWSSFVIELEHWEADKFRLTSGLLEDHFVQFRVGKTGPDALQFEGQLFVRK